MKKISSTFIYSELNEKTLARFEYLKFISTRSTGVTHIDADEIKEMEQMKRKRKIRFLNFCPTSGDLYHG